MNVTKADPVILDLSQVDLTITFDDLPPELIEALHRVLDDVEVEEGEEAAVSAFNSHI